jgi:benzylsuccinate CoA-transferase BbsE subunit
VDDPLAAAVEYAGRLLAGLGADVVKLEPPAGAPSRALPPFCGRTRRSLFFAHYNVGKRSVVVASDDEIRSACAGADVVIHTMRPQDAAVRGLGPDAFDARTVVCAVTPFGQDGPWADFVADDLVLLALGGSMAACGYGPAEPPMASMGEQAWHTAATYAAIATCAALVWRDDPAGGHGRGQFVDVSAHECSASMTEWHVMNYVCTGEPLPRFRHPTVSARDGKEVAALTPDFLGPHVFANLLAMLEADGVAGPLADPAFADPAHRAAHYGEVFRAVKRLGERHDGEELFRLGQSAGLPWGVIRATEEVLDDPQLEARGHWVEFDGLRHAGAPFVAERSPFRFAGPPPALGANTREILGW